MRTSIPCLCFFVLLLLIFIPCIQAYQGHQQITQYELSPAHRIKSHSLLRSLQQNDGELALLIEMVLAFFLFLPLVAYAFFLNYEGEHSQFFASLFYVIAYLVYQFGYQIYGWENPF